MAISVFGTRYVCVNIAYANNWCSLLIIQLTMFTITVFFHNITIRMQRLLQQRHELQPQILRIERCIW
jgi:hypothetical protein